MYMNKVVVGGYLTRDPEMKKYPSRTGNGDFTVTDIGVAMNRRYVDRNGQRQEETCFVDCNLFGRFAEIVNDKFTKGMPILIEGRLRFRTWQTEDGQNASKLDIYVENFSFVPNGTKPEDANAIPGEPMAPSAQPVAAPTNVDGDIPF